MQTQPRNNTVPAEMTLEELTSYERAQAVAIAEKALDDAKKGREQAMVYFNGCTSKAALVRKRTAELAEAKASTRPADAWSVLVEASYARARVSVELLQSFSDVERHGVRSLRAQAIDNLLDKGYVLDGGFYVPSEAKPTRFYSVAA